MMRFMTPFEIVLVPFPFADLSSNKRRPCLILSIIKPKKLGEHAIVAMITSQLSGPRFPFDIELLEYKFSGLPKPSLVRLAKIVTVDRNLIIKKLGSLHQKDQKVVKLEFQKLFNSMI